MRKNPGMGILLGTILLLTGMAILTPKALAHHDFITIMDNGGGWRNFFVWDVPKKVRVINQEEMQPNDWWDVWECLRVDCPRRPQAFDNIEVMRKRGVAREIVVDTDMGRIDMQKVREAMREGKDIVLVNKSSRRVSFNLEGLGGRQGSYQEVRFRNGEARKYQGVIDDEGQTFQIGVAANSIGFLQLLDPGDRARFRDRDRKIDQVFRVDDWEEIVVSREIQTQISDTDRQRVRDTIMQRDTPEVTLPSAY